MSFKLIVSDKRFWPLFWTQFLGALNDNVLKNALVVMVAFKGVAVMGLAPASVVALAGGLFILPFFLFSASAGQLADKYERSRLVRITKWWEVAIMAIAAVGFYTHMFSLLLAVLFLAGVQATLFGPVKYSMIPDLVRDDELIEANAYIELGTFLAILIGTITGGVLVTLDGGEFLIIGTLLGLSLLGVATGYQVKKVKVACPDLVIQLNPIPASSLSILKQSKAIFNSVLAISWFWFFGAAILSLLPVYVKDFLHGTEQVVTCFLAMFTIGIGVGSLLCEKLSFRRVEIGLVPIGSLGMSIFLFDLFLVDPGSGTQGAALGLMEFIKSAHGPRLLIDFLMMSIFGGFFILPLYTLIQDRSDPQTRSRVIAGNNIVNAMFMVVSSGMIIAFHALHLTFPQIFAIIAVMNLLVSIYIYSVVPEFTLRFFSWVLARALYRIRITNESKIPKTGAAVLVCNHVSYVDWLIIMALVRRPARFVMHHKFFHIPVIKFLMKQAKVIPIAGKSENPKVLQAAMAKISEELRSGELVCIFPEGTVTRHGHMNEFRRGIEQIIARDPVPVIPMALKGLWGTLFSFSDGKVIQKLPRKWMSRVDLKVGHPVPPEKVSAANLEQLVSELHGA